MGFACRRPGRTRQGLFPCFHRLEEGPIRLPGAGTLAGAPPYADEALAELRRGGCKLALCTSNTPEVVNTYLELAGWADAFDAVITGDLVTKSKPDPEIYLTAAQKLGVRPDECVGVEDSFNGIRSVRAAGMVSVMIPDLLPYGEELAPYVDRHFDDLGGMMAWLNA